MNEFFMILFKISKYTEIQHITKEKIKKHTI